VRTLLLLPLLVACKLDNPRTTRDIVWSDPETEALARRACYDCHSNDTHWPWYSNVPVVGNLVAGDVHRGRCHMNFSEWDGPNEEAEEAPEEVREGEMPLGMYTAAHPEARLTPEEREQLAQGLARTFAADPPRAGEACED
jgi:hypothetical protein